MTDKEFRELIYEAGYKGKIPRRMLKKEKKKFKGGIKHIINGQLLTF